ncbi:Queuine tRNA-ribosyltransferase subunit qtrtd1 [Mactra antiquata]
MKFNIQCVRGNQARLGYLAEVGCHGNKTLETPLCMLYTKGGSAPYITAEVLKKLQDVPSMAHMPLNQVASFQETIAGFKDGIAKFAALDNQLVYTSNNDPAVEVPTGYNTKTGIGLWGKGGKTQLDCEGYIQCIEAMIPDWFQSMSDADTDSTSTNKRAGKAVERTIKFLDLILENLKTSKTLEKSVLFGSIVGGYDMGARKKCICETVARNVQGFVLEGFHRLGPSTEDFDIKQHSDFISNIIKLLPDDAPRLMHNVWRPDSILIAIELGIDVFDSSYPLYMLKFILSLGCGAEISMLNFEYCDLDSIPSDCWSYILT